MDAESVFFTLGADSAIDRAEVAGRRARGWDVDERVPRVSGCASRAAYHGVGVWIVPRSRTIARGVSVKRRERWVPHEEMLTLQVRFSPATKNV